MTIESISAVTLCARDIARAAAFYEALGFERVKGGFAMGFVSFRVGRQFLNLQQADGKPPSGWGRVIFYVTDVDDMYHRALSLGFAPAFAPRDAPWGERYFHIGDPEGHEISFARPLGD